MVSSGSSCREIIKRDKSIQIPAVSESPCKNGARIKNFFAFYSDEIYTETKFRLGGREIDEDVVSQHDNKARKKKRKSIGNDRASYNMTVCTMTALLLFE